MEARELRIGNWVMVDGTEVTKVVSINGIGINLTADINEYGKAVIIENTLDETIAPIPITEKWLLKFGFKNTYGIGDDYEITIQDNIGEGNPQYDIYWHSEQNEISISNNDSNWLETKIKFVHQLQNLYFALTGEELQIK